MRIGERMQILRQQGWPTSAIAAILGIEPADVVAHLADPSHVPAGFTIDSPDGTTHVLSVADDGTLSTTPE